MLMKEKLRFSCVSTLLLSFLLPSITIAAPLLWQGPYIGGYLGGGFGYQKISSSTGNVSDTSYFTSNAQINAVNTAASSTHYPNTLIAGIQAGHDWVWKQIVYGVAADYGSVSLNSSKNIVNQAYPDTADQFSVYTSMTANWLFTLRGRLGYQMTCYWPSLLYLTGGMAITQLTVKNRFSDNSTLAGAGGNTTSDNQIGWTAGVGIELLKFCHASVAIEYLYVQVPSVKTSGLISNTEGGFGIPPQSLSNRLSSTGKFHANLLKIGLNYRFDE